MKSKDSKKKPRSYHGNHDEYVPMTYKDEYGKVHKKEICYFNCFLDKSNMDKGEYDHRKFNYLLHPNKADLLPANQKTIDQLKELADLMIENATQTDLTKIDSTIPPGYTYWGQFLDHDITAGTGGSHGNTITKDNFDPVAPNQVIKDIKNMRTPFFDLDSVYGDKDGPFGAMFKFYDPNDIVKLKIGNNETAGNIPGVVPNPELGLQRDLPRNNDQILPDEFKTIAIIGDSRNDENTLVAQFHLAFLKFHNRVVDEIRNAGVGAIDNKSLFYSARKEVVNHYHWLILHDFLQRILDRDVYQSILDEYYDAGSPSIFEEFGNGTPFMPLEFSTAAYRFGHSMVRSNYDFNQNFGDKGLADNRPGEVLSDASFSLLFAFTGKGGERLANEPQPTIKTTLPFNWIIEWERFFDTDVINKGKKRFARKIDTMIAQPLENMENEKVAENGSDQSVAAAKQFNAVMGHLVRRNLLRGYLLSIPTAQALIHFLESKCISIPTLTSAQIMENNTVKLNKLLESSGFLEKTPLWYYILKEAEVINKGNQLGPLGSYIVGRTFVGLLKLSRKKCLGEYEMINGWSPNDGIVVSSTKNGFNGIMDLLRFAGVAKPNNTMMAQTVNKMNSKFFDSTMTI